jgi:hypothetical protein
MAKYNYKSKNGRVGVELDASSPKEAWAEIATFQEIFEETNCGKCDSGEVKFVVRSVKDDDYYELRCLKCGAKLAFGQHKNGKTLFPSRKDSSGEYLPTNGWVKWDGTKNV